MKLFHSILFAFAGLCMCACGDDDPVGIETPPVTPPVENDVLTLETSKSVIVANGEDVADFIVKYNDTQVKENVTIYDENGKTYPVAEGFKTANPGNYTFWAEYKGIHSEKITLKAVSEGPRLKMTLSKAIIEANGKDAVNFIVTYDDEPVTEGVTIYGNNDQALASSTSFTTTEPGEYTFWAAYKTEHTKSFTVKAISLPVPQLPEDATPEKVDFTKKVLLTKFTGTTCGYCPRMTVLLRKTLEDQSVADKVLITEAHTFNRSDPGYYSNVLAQAFGISSYPTMVVNFEKSFGYNVTPEQFRGLINDEHKIAAQAGISAKSELATTADGKKQIVLHVAVKAAVEGEFRVGAWLLEDGIKGRQAGAEGFEGDFNTHNNVVRVADSKHSTSNYSGIVLGKLEKGETAEHVFIMDLKDKWVLDNCHSVIFVTMEKERTLPVVNAVACPVEASLPFNYAE